MLKKLFEILSKLPFILNEIYTFCTETWPYIKENFNIIANICGAAYFYTRNLMLILAILLVLLITILIFSRRKISKIKKIQSEKAPELEFIPFNQFLRELRSQTTDSSFSRWVERKEFSENVLDTMAYHTEPHAILYGKRLDSDGHDVIKNPYSFSEGGGECTNYEGLKYTDVSVKTIDIKQISEKALEMMRLFG